MTARMPDIAQQSSERERVAVDAERDTEQMKKAEYMLDKVGEEFEGIISSVTSFGMFIELDNTVEGLTRLSALTDDYYHFDEQHMALIGERTSKVFRIGDEVKVRVARVNMEDYTIDFELVDMKQRQRRERTGGTGQGGDFARGESRGKGKGREGRDRKGGKDKTGKERKGGRDVTGKPKEAGAGNGGISTAGRSGAAAEAVLGLAQLAASALAVVRAGITRQHPGQASDGRRRLPAVFSSAEQLHQVVMPDQTVKAQHVASGRIRAEVSAIAPRALCGKRRSR